MDKMPTFIVEYVAEKHSDELKGHRSFVIDCGVLYVAFTPNEQGFDISLAKKFLRQHDVDVSPTEVAKSLFQGYMDMLLQFQ